ncbi:NADP-dependent succinic semialdehyde dehydrogenase [Mycobacterium tuberculosis]|uniref:Succinate-semialdehyde dehydrogenase [NADP(+)] 1 n=13 Tax=Mycobacterium tuberculosis complex TaxID=77643 RepID=A0A679LAK0_MYCBO|nr:NADP-dependent succinic semialdehyde dehydrogenase [Mycobacterium tuberculosis]NP_216247.2 succinate-semialdehyde dehydrogenase [Mycobacterium tuberculosis H37Rv]ABQ71959.1 succinic semialdehyde dehydrogenase [Mycobacterium tuberculosis H37Ra]ABR04579.1 succinate-semialdehyde dehydrogenase [NADP+]-dependent gabD1 [Mycobacterium tuberculosis F11]ACT23263.1 succinate-semialdehyde dehydrogenase [NADP+] dependent gabD1 [Mycobacterium tuberculosis KZN 1435]AEB02367.1 succinate-semialdehyde dehyd
MRSVTCSATLVLPVIEPTPADRRPRHLLLGSAGHVSGRLDTGRFVQTHPAKDVSVPIATINPATGETVKTFTAATDDEVDAAIARAHRRFADYRQTSFAQRARWANATADLLEAEADQAAAMMTLEMGKTLAAAKAEALKCAKGFRYYAENAEALLADEPADAAKVGASAAYGRYQPLGVILAVMPWNFPLWQAVRFAAPALMAGNVGLLKHASNVPQCALYLADVIARGGFPDGCFQTLLVSSGAVEAILRDPRVAAATLTGSEPAGQSVGAIAGNEIKPTVLELGGSDPFIVMPSADLDAAVSTAVTGRVQNNGQSCIAAKRFIVHADIYDDFVDKFVARMAALRVGDPTDPDTDVGPLATEQGRNEVAKQVEDAAAAGAVIRCGGKRLDRPGWFYPPTVITDISKDMALYTEEVFGPVASVFRAANIDEAVEIANATTFGLGSNAWTRDETEQRRFIDDIVAGQVFINGMTVSYPELPFGGVKRSGYGRELSAHGIREFCNIKTVWIA